MIDIGIKSSNAPFLSSRMGIGFSVVSRMSDNMKYSVNRKKIYFYQYCSLCFGRTVFLPAGYPKGTVEVRLVLARS